MSLKLFRQGFANYRGVGSGLGNGLSDVWILLNTKKSTTV
jgi:hypothetical protein